MQDVDFIIVGQGLAGSCLALELLNRGHTILVIDKPNSHTASRVAAGLFNPITGRTNKPTWRATEIFQVLTDFYSRAEQDLGRKFLHFIPIYRPFLSQEEQMNWPAESNEWVLNVYRQARYPEMVNDAFGGIEIRKSGFLDTQVFIEGVRNRLIKQNCLYESKFDSTELIVREKVVYKQFQCDRIIFCEGIESIENPFFNWLPIRKLKGELLYVEGNLPTDVIVNRGIFAVPIVQSNEFIVGSTYWHDSTPGVTQAGINELNVRTAKLFKTELKIKAMNWGHRPTTVDRRPILGTHPAHKTICIFNGLGTKGVSLAPFFALQFVNWLQGKEELDKEVNIERFYSLSLKVSGV